MTQNTHYEELVKSHKQKFIFFGKVIPERKAFNMEHKYFAIEFHNEHGVISGFFDIGVLNSQLLCGFITNDEIKDKATFINGIKGIIDFNINAMSFIHDTSIAGVDIVQVYDSLTDTSEILDTVTQADSKSASQFTHNDITAISARHQEIIPYLSIALSDFNKALSSVYNTGFHCYRATESLMRSIPTLLKQNEHTQNNQGWEIFRDLLLIDLEVMKFIKKFSDLERHGIPTAITSNDRENIIDPTRQILENYIQYCKTGSCSAGVQFLDNIK